MEGPASNVQKNGRSSFKAQKYGSLSDTQWYGSFHVKRSTCVRSGFKRRENMGAFALNTCWRYGFKRSNVGELCSNGSTKVFEPLLQARKAMGALILNC